jgi:hypothetical protein
MQHEDIQSISSRKFQTLKTRHIVIDTLLRKHVDLKGARRHQLIDTVWHGDFTSASDTLSSLTLKSKVMKRIPLAADAQKMEDLDSFLARWLSKDHRRIAFGISDIQFLAGLADMTKDDTILKRFELETLDAFKDHFDVIVEKLSKTLRTEAISILQEERKRSLRADLFRQISDATRSQSHLCASFTTVCSH